LNSNEFSSAESRLGEVRRIISDCASKEVDLKAIVSLEDEFSIRHIESLLAQESVAGVVMPANLIPDQLRSSAPIGRRVGSQLENWTLPKTNANCLILLDDQQIVKFRSYVTALARGIHHVYRVQKETGQVGKSHIALVLGKRVLGRVHAALPSSIGTPMLRAFLRLRPLSRAAFIKSAIQRTYRAELIVKMRTKHLIQKYSASPSASVRADERIVVLAIGSLGAGGAERQLVNTALMIARSGYARPVVACADLSKPALRFHEQTLNEAGIELVDVTDVTQYGGQGTSPRLNPEVLNDLTIFPQSLRVHIAQYMRLCLYLKPAVFHSFLDYTNVIAGLGAQLAGVPRIVLSGRSVAPDNFGFDALYWNLLYKRLAKCDSVILTNNSKAGAADYKRWLRTPRLNIPVVNNGIDFDDFASSHAPVRDYRKELSIPEGRLLIGTVTRFSEEKRPELFARAAVEIARHMPDTYFVMAGDGPYRAYVENIVSRAGISNRFYFLGQIRTVSDLLKTLDLFVLTSRKEGLPNVLIEAQSLGVPVVTTPAGGAVETLDPNKTGKICQEHSATSIADQCLEILLKDDLRHRMRESAPGFVREHFSIQRMFQNTLQLYNGEIPR